MCSWQGRVTVKFKPTKEMGSKTVVVPEISVTKEKAGTSTVATGKKAISTHQKHRPLKNVYSSGRREPKLKMLLMLFPV